MNLSKLTRDELDALLTQAEESFPHARDICSTCECFLGYLAQLRIDSTPPALRAPSPNPQEEASTQSDVDLRIWGTPSGMLREGLGRGKVDRKDMHRCLGCDPCPPGDLYAEYMKKKQSSKLITL